MTIARTATLRETLGLKDAPPNGQAWHALLQQGLPYRSFSSLAKALHVKEPAMAEILEITGRALAARKKAKRLSAAESDHAYAIARAYVRLAGFKGVEGAVTWLLNPAEVLKGLRPVEFLRSRIGTEYVMNAIDRMRPAPMFSENKLALDDAPEDAEEEERRPPF